MDASRVNESYDLIVVGAGISGLAVTRQAANKGLKVLLIERAEIGAATSDNSLRIIHGGFRYLQNLAIARVIFSLKEQARVLAEFPDLVRELPCFLPLQKFGLKAALPLNCARLIYRGLGLAAGIVVPKSELLSSAQATEKLPLLEGAVPHGAFLWTDLQLLSPHLLHSRLAEQACAAGADISIQSPVTNIEAVGKEYQVTCKTEGIERVLRTKFVVNCAGPWANSRALNAASSTFPAIGWCRAFNLVFEGNSYGSFGFALAAAQGRQYFVVGRDNEIAVGTEYLPFDGDPAHVELTESEIGTFLSRFEGRVRALSLSMNSFKRVELGVLPITVTKNSIESSLVGAAQIAQRGGLISLLSTKYTTFLGQADEIIARVEQEMR